MYLFCVCVYTYVCAHVNVYERMQTLSAFKYNGKNYRVFFENIKLTIPLVY